DDLGTGDIRWKDTWFETLSSGLTAGDTLKLRGRDVNGAAYVDILTITSNNTVTADLHSSVTHDSNTILTDASTASALTSFGASPTIVTPTIASFVSATHNHSNAAGAGDLTDIQATSVTLTGTTQTDVDTLVKGNIVKGWANFDGDAFGQNDDFNVSGIAQDGTGLFTVSWDTDFASADYAVACSGDRNDAVESCVVGGVVYAAGSVQIDCQTAASAAHDPTVVNVIAIGDQS
ncbi:hypothetical protein LCGC14_2026190, partial [marine sediment metagenome]